MLKYLGQPGDSGKDLLPAGKVADLSTESDEDIRLFRTGTDQVHVSDQHVPELRELIEPILPEELAGSGNSRVPLLGPDLGRVRVRLDHRAELVDGKDATSVVVGSSRILTSATKSAPVQTHTRLREEDRSSGAQLHDYRNDQHQGR